MLHRIRMAMKSGTLGTSVYTDAASAYRNLITRFIHGVVDHYCPAAAFINRDRSAARFSISRSRS